MFESKLTAVLQKYLGDYVYGLDKDALKVSIWSGNLVLKNLKLKPESLKFLGIPGLVVKTGLLGSLTLRIPWNRLGSEPVIVEFDRIYVLASLDASGKSNLYDDVEQADEVTANARRRRIDAAVQQRMESRGGPGGEDSEKEGEKNDGGYINHLVQTIIGNLQIIITNLHVRIEDSYWGFSVALTIEEISGITINDKGEPEFVSSVKANERLRKRLKLRKLTLYIDPNSREMTSESPWEDLNILAWDNFFLPNIKAEDKDIQQTFFLRPVNAELIYDRSKGKDNETQQNIKLTFEEVGLNALQQQYLSIQRLLQTFEVVSARAPYSHIRPHCSVRASPRAWWVYAVNAFHSSGLVRKRISMSHLIGWNRKRKDYVDAYLEHLEAEAEAKSDEGESQALRKAEELEEDLHEKTIVFFRCLAIGEHKRREGQRKKAESGRGWFFGWGAPNKTEEDEDLNFGQTDWEKLEEIYLQDGSGDAGSSGPLGSTTYVDVEITSTSLRLQNGDTEVLLGNVKEVRVNAAFVSGLLSVTSSVESYLLQSQNLEIMKSGSIASNVHALDLTVKQSLDNDLHLTHVEASIAPCFVEISKSSIENIIVYFQAHDKGTRLTTLGMQAGAAAQELGKNTAEQLQVAIASRPLVTFSLDIQAPKVAIVWGDSPAMRTLIVNLGRIMLCSEDSDDEKVWQKVRLNLSDSEVYIADGELQWKNVDTATFSDCTCLDLPKSSLLDKFGMELLLQYGDLSSEDSELSLDLHVPELFLHFSPMVINNAMKLVQYYTSLSALLGSGDNWEDADLTDYVQIAILSEAPTTNEKLSPILSPKKRHNMTMNWIHSCKIFLQNDTLYADIPGSHLQRRIFLGNASQISTVPSRFVDNRENVIIITESEERLRRALNTDNSIVIAYDNEERKGLWLQHLQSRNQHLKGFGLKRSQSNEFSDEKQDVAQQQKSLSIHIDGKLDVFHLFVKGRAYNPAQKGYSIEPFFSFDTREETDLINVNAKGVSVAIDTSSAGMHLEAILNSLFVEDLLLGKEYDQCKFLIASETEQSPADVDEQIVTRVETLGTIDQEGDVFYDPDDVFATGSKDNSLAIIKFSSSSDEAAGNTTELDVNLSKISVYVNRPTIAALMVIGQDIGYYLGDGGEESSEAKVEEDLEMSTVLLPSNQEADTVVNKDVFTFKLQMKEAKFIFNYEMRKTPLAILAAESLSLNIDLSEGDFLLKASLGNLKVADCSVDSTHMYYWAVDIYESESGSLIDLTLGSVDKSEDITGADMFIDAHMNSISVVFLNKFLTEILLFIQNLFLYQPELLGGGPIQPEIDPEAKPLLLRLNVSLDAPMIKLPRSTASPDYLELTPGEVKVKNKFLIHPCGEKDIFVDEMEILLTGVKGTACMNGKRGTDILDDTVLKVILSRPLNFAENADNTLGVKVLSSETNAKLSKKEYHFVISVAGENFSEEMVFKPSFQLPLPEQETMIANQDPADDGLRGVSVNVSLSAVSVLMYGEGEKSPFASLKSKNLQTYLLVDFKDESLDITLSIPQIQVENVEKHTVVLCSGNSLAFSQPEESTLDPSLLFLRFRTKANHSELDLKLQEPRIFGENKFIMNMLDFFVPTVIPEDILQCTTIDDPNYKADCNVYLSPATRICAASSESDLFIYDGNGFSLVFPKDNFEREKVPLVYVATNKTLKICNTTIVNFSQMSSYTELMANAKIEFENVQYEDGEEVFTRTGSQAVANEETHMELSIQAHNFLFEFTLMNEDTSLSAQGNADVSFHIADKSQHLRTKVEDLFLFVREKSSMKSDFQIESDAHSAKNAITLLHPCTLGVDFVSEESSDMLHVNVSNLNFQVSPMTIQFLLQLQEEIMTSLGRAPPEKPLMRVLHFKRIVSLEVSPGTLLTFWRPICDSKYAIIGDCISFGDRPPTKNVSVVAKGYGMVKEPLDFECVITEENIKIWHPIAPEGYISLGCIASDGGKPDTSDVYCIHRSLTIQALTEEYFSPASSIYSIVNVRNHFGNFIVLSSTQECACLDVLAPSEIIEELPNQVPGTEQLSNDIGESQQDIYMDRKVTNLEKERSKPYLRYVVRFQRLMKNKGGNYSFWRPILPDDCYSLGDIAMDGLTPPAKALCIHKTAEDVIASPIKFSLVRIEGKISIWRPVAPDGYVAMGYLLSTSTDAPPIDSICCVKASYVAKPLTFNMVEIKTHKENLYVFTFDDILKTFIISESKTLPEEGYALNFEEEEEYDDGAEKKKRMIVTTKCGNIKLTVSDSVQTPKFEVQLVDILVSMEGKGEESTLMCTFGLSLSSYNSKLLSWESIVDKSELILKIKNSSSKFNSIALPKELGIDLSFTSPLHITIAHACLESALYLLSEWSDMARSGSLFVNQDLDCLNTTVTNEIGSDFYLRLKYNNGTEKIEKIGTGSQEVLQPFKTSLKLKNAKMLDLGDNYVRVTVESLSGSLSMEPNMLYMISATLQCKDQELSSCIATRFFCGFDEGDFHCDETLLLPLSPDMKCLLHGGDLAEDDILSVNLNLWQTAHSDTQTKELIATIAYPILKEPSSVIEESKYPFPFSDDTKATSGLFLTFALAFPKQKPRELAETNFESETYIGVTEEGPWMPLSSTKPIEMSNNTRNPMAKGGSGTISPFKMGASSIILESNLIAGRKLERFRSNVQVYNASQTSFDVGIKKVIPAELNVFEVEGDHDPVDGKYFVSVFENQRFNVTEGWKHSGGDNKRSKYSTFYGKCLSTKDFPNLPLPLGWEWCGEWTPRKVPHTDKKGWCYFKNFAKFQYPPPKASRSKGLTDNVRSRCFIRYCKHTTLTDEEIAVISLENNSIVEVGTVKQHEQLVIPKKFCAVGSILELVWRPSICLANTEDKVYNWSVLLSTGSEIMSLACMEETSQLMACAPNPLEGVEEEPLLFSATSEGVELSSYSQIVTDWRINIAPAVSIENCTGVNATVNLWEHQKGILPALRCKTTTLPHSTMENLKIDPRKMLSMALVPDGWEWEKGRNPIALESNKKEMKSSKLTLVKDKNYIILQMTKARVNPKFEFPYYVKVWSEYCIQNETGLPIQFCVVERDSDFEELTSSAIRTIVAEESSGHVQSLQKQTVMPGMSELFSGLRSSGNCGIQVAIKDSGWTVESIPLVPGGDIILVQAYCPYSSLVYSVTVSARLHDLAPTTIVTCKPHLVCSNFTGRIISVCRGQGMESTAQKVEVNGRGVEIHSADKGKMDLRLKVDGYLWSTALNVKYPNGPNTDLILESEDLTHARILSVKTRLESPGCLHIQFISFNLLEYSPPYSVVNFSSEILMYRQPNAEEALWTQIEPYTSCIPKLRYGDSSTRMDGGVKIELKANDAPSRIYTLYSGSSSEKDFSMDADEEDAEVQLDTKQDFGLNTKLVPLPIDAFPGECEAMLVRTNKHCRKLVISKIFNVEKTSRKGKHCFTPLHTEFNLTFAADYLDVSIVNSVPKEIALLTVKGLQFSLSDGVGISDDKIMTNLQIEDIEIDDMNPLSEYPVAIMCRKKNKPFLSLALHQMKSHLQPSLHVSYSDLLLRRPLEVEIHETLIWEFVSFLQSLSLDRLESRQDAYVDPDMQVDILSVAGLTAKINFMSDSSSRPKNLNFISKFGLKFANIENLSISILRKWEVRNLSVKQSVFMRLLFSRISRDVSKQILPILFSGLSLNTVSNVTTGAISSIANAAAVLSLDDKFEKDRDKKATHSKDLADGLASGGESLAKGVVSGITGIFTKPIEGAKKGGAKGFAKGFAKGILGAAAKPISGALDMVSKSVEGGLATIDGVKSIAEVSKKRLRYPRAITGNMILKPYNAFASQGQQIFKTSVIAGDVENLEFTKGLNPFTKDFYEYHEPLPSDRVVIVTDQRVLCIKVPKGSLEGGTILWHAHFLDILSLEIPDISSESPRILTIILSANMGSKFTFQKQKLQHEVHCYPKQNQAKRLFQVISEKRQSCMNALHKPDILLSVSDVEDEEDKDMPATVECSDFVLAWHSGDYKGENVYVWRPKCPPGYSMLGDMASYGTDKPPNPTMIVKDSSYQDEAWLAKPVSYKLEWRETKKGKSSPAAFWIPIPPEGYVALGCLAQTGNTEPSVDLIRCVKKSMVFETSIYDSSCWSGTSNDRQGWPLSLWQVDNSLHTFIPCRSKTKPVGLTGFDLMM